MRFLKRAAILTFLAAAIVGRALAQTTQTTQPAAATESRGESPATASWQSFVAQFATALADSADSDHLDAMLADDVSVHRFGRTEREGVTRVRDRAGGKTVAAARAYVGTPSLLATDLAGDFRDAAVPDALKRIMIPIDDAERVHANRTSSEWINSTLKPEAKDLVGVIVLVSADSAVEHSAAVQPALFILIKADPAPDGHFQAKLVIYGDPRE